jgi:RNA polymerase sigma-70 factor (ECF subfamily)
MDAGTLPDEQLMLRAVGGDVEAFGELYDRYQPRLLAFLSRLCGDVSTAEDAVQDAFRRAWEYRTSFRGSGFRAWLYVIAKNAALAERRSRVRAESFSALDSDEWERIPEAPEAEPGRRAEAEFLREEVRRALLELPREQRLCLILREYEELSHRETAEVLGCSEGAVRVLAYRARRALAKRLRGALEGAESEDLRV